MSTLNCAVAKQDSSFDFSVVVQSKADLYYAIDNAWVQVRNSDGSGTKYVTRHKGDITADNVALTEFHEADVVAKLGMSVSALQANGFQIRLKIESLGAGSGRQQLPEHEGDGGWLWQYSVDPMPAEKPQSAGLSLRARRGAGFSQPVQGNAYGPGDWHGPDKDLPQSLIPLAKRLAIL